MTALRRRRWARLRPAATMEETQRANPAAARSTTTLSFDPGSLDPDLFYGNEGLLITTSCYDGLLKYKNNTTEIVPALAESYEVSNGREALHVQAALRRASSPTARRSTRRRCGSRSSGAAGRRRPGVHGRARSSRRARRIASTLVVELKTPINPFTSWLASPYGLKIVNPKLVEANEKGDDAGPGVDGRPTAPGTGPYDLRPHRHGQRYELERQPELLGRRSRTSARSCSSMIPSFSTQALQLRVGRARPDDARPHEGRRRARSRPTGLRGRPSCRASPRSTCGSTPTSPTSRTARCAGRSRWRSTARSWSSEVYGDDAEVYNGCSRPGRCPRSTASSRSSTRSEAKAIVDGVPEDRRKHHPAVHVRRRDRTSRSRASSPSSSTRSASTSTSAACPRPRCSTSPRRRTTSGRT